MYSGGQTLYVEEINVTVTTTLSLNRVRFDYPLNPPNTASRPIRDVGNDGLSIDYAAQGPYTFTFRIGAKRAKDPANPISVKHSLDRPII